MDEETFIRWPSENRHDSDSKLRRGKQHCPICLTPLAKNATRTRLLRKCLSCQGQPSEGKHCRRCAGAWVWENRDEAACQGCGLHGEKGDVITT